MADMWMQTISEARSGRWTFGTAHFFLDGDYERKALCGFRPRLDRVWVVDANHKDAMILRYCESCAYNAQVYGDSD